MCAQKIILGEMLQCSSDAKIGLAMTGVSPTVCADQDTAASRAFDRPAATEWPHTGSAGQGERFDDYSSGGRNALDCQTGRWRLHLLLMILQIPGWAPFDLAARPLRMTGDGLHS